MSPTTNFALGLIPIVGALGVVGGKFGSRAWYSLVAVAFALTMQSPSRTATLSLVVTLLSFYLWLPPTEKSVMSTHSPRRRGARIVLLVVVAALGLAYFLYVGNLLDKADQPAGLGVAPWLPSFLVQPLLYELGGVSALSVVLGHHFIGAGPYGAFGSSIYAVVKVASLFGYHFPTPDRFASYVDIPVPLNTYTAFGDTYFDLGLIGVVVLFLVAGLLVFWVHKSSRNGRVGATWALGVLMSALLATPLHMRLLDGDVLVQIAAGVMVLGLVTRKRSQTGQQAETAVGSEMLGEDLARLSM